MCESSILRDHVYVLLSIVKINELDSELFGSRQPNGSYTGTIGRLIKLESEAGFAAFFIKDYLTEDIEFTTTLYKDDLCILVQKAKRIPPLILPLSCFEPSLWLLLLFWIIVSAVIWIIFRKLNKIPEIQGFYEINGVLNRFNQNQRFSQLLVDTVIIGLSAPLRHIPKVTSERFFIATIFLISLIFVSMFQSRLASVFITPLYYKEINTLSDFSDSDLKISIKFQAMFDDVFPENTSNIIFGKLREKLNLIPMSSPDVTSDVAEKGGYATLERKASVHLTNLIYLIKNQVHLIQECPRSYNLGFALPKNSAFMPRINEILMRLLNGGFINKWIDEMAFNMTLSNLKNYGKYQLVNYRILTVSDMEFSFLVLGTGIGISFIVFFMEILFNYSNSV